ncbi:MAG: hypothetical protein FLDDKLPJ_01813 [Phycisphaerae bacterium]|nr:hypothetical protein [Phycisphaerae bacterium]
MRDVSDGLSERVRTYEGPLLGYAQRLTGCAETARDVVQDTLLRWMSADRSRLNGNETAWLFTVCRNRALDVIRSRARERPAGDLAAAQTATRGRGVVGRGEESSEPSSGARTPLDADGLRGEVVSRIGARPDPSQASAADAASAREEQARALAELARLPANQQEVLVLRFQCGLSYKEIAEVTGLNIGYVGYLMHVGLKTLRERLGEEGLARRDV